MSLSRLLYGLATPLYIVKRNLTEKIGGPQCKNTDRQKQQLSSRSTQPVQLAVYYAEYVINMSRRPHACARNEIGWKTVGNDESSLRAADVIAELGGAGRGKKRYTSGHMQLTGWNWLCLAIWAARRETVDGWVGVYGNSQQSAASTTLARC